MEEKIKAALLMRLLERTPNAAKRFFPQALWSLPERRDEIFLTFDDGPHPPFTAQLLGLLAAQQCRATFFLIGEKARSYPSLGRESVAAGHVIGNHTMRHRRLRWQRHRTVHEEIHSAQRIIEDQVGKAVEYFRPPYGHLSPAIVKAAKSANLQIAMWSLMPGDFFRADAPQAIAASILMNARDGDIVLLHDGHRCAPATMAALREALPILQEKGFRFRALTQQHVD
jgi:peptidoglycan/xylan/chitin deacetylase (PgdA/CDA1 family)